MNIAICGYPRSGSTLFYNMLRHTVCDHLFFDYEASMIEVASVQGEKITKKPTDCFYAGGILKAVPDARFIAVIRDPRSVLCSKHATTGDLYKVSWDHTIFGSSRQRWLRNRRNRTPEPGDYQAHWGLLDWDRAIDALPDPVIVHYEDLVRRPQETQERLCDELGLETRGEFTAFHTGHIPAGLAKQLNGVRPVEPSRLESWREHPERIRQQFGECPALHDIVIRRGYEKDAAWIDRL